MVWPPRPRAKTLSSRTKAKAFSNPVLLPFPSLPPFVPFSSRYNRNGRRGRNSYSHRNRAGFLCWPHCHRCKGYRGCRPPSDPFQRPTRRRKISPGPPWLFCSVSSAPSTSRLCTRSSCAFESWTRSSFENKKKKNRRHRFEFFSKTCIFSFFFLYIYKRRDLTHLKKKRKRYDRYIVEVKRERYGLHAEIATQFRKRREEGNAESLKKKIHERTIIDKCGKKEIYYVYLSSVEFSDRSCNLQRLAGMGWVLFGSPPSTPLRNISF